MIDIASLVSSRRFRLLWLAPAGLAAAVILGLAAARYGPPALALAAGPALALLVGARPELGVYAITLSLPVEDLLPGVGSATGTRLIGIAVFGVWMARRVLRREPWLPVLRTPVILSALAFTAWAFASGLWAEHKNAFIAGMISQAQLLALAMIVVDSVRSFDRAAWIARLLVLGGLIAAGFTLEQYFVEGVRRAGDNIAGGINYTASFLVTILPFAFYVVRAGVSRLWALLGLLYIPLGIVAVTVTFSRSSYIMLVLALAANAWLLLRSRAGGGWLLLLVSLIAAAVYLTPQEAINERVQSIPPLLSSWFEPSAAALQQADARSFHWKVGMEMFRESPLVGVGFNNFGEQFLRHQFDVRGTPEIFTNPRSSHSSFVGILVETGVIGIAIFGVIIAAGLYNLYRAARLLDGKEDFERLFLVQAATIVFIMQILYGWALNTHMNKNFWLFLGMTVVLYRLARRPRPAGARRMNR